MNLLTGALVPSAPWTLPFLGVASRAINLLAEDGAAVSIIGDPGNMDARGLCISEMFDDFRVQALRALEDAREAGTSCLITYDGHSLTLVDGVGKGVGDELRADLVEVWDPRLVLELTARRLAGTEPDGWRRLAELVQGLSATEVAAVSGKGTPDDGIHGTGVFARMFARLSVRPEFPVNLVGFGPGSTPAGDDWLAGYLMCLDLAAGGPGRADGNLREALTVALGENPRRTTSMGMSLLASSVSGMPPAYLVDLAVAMSEGNLPALGDAVRKALSHGASSGRDALAGVVAALAENGMRRRLPGNPGSP